MCSRYIKLMNTWMHVISVELDDERTESTQKAMKIHSDCTKKRKRIEEVSSCPAVLETGNGPDAHGPPKKKRTIGPCRHQKATTKPATFLSRYVTGKKLGEGGCGSVFEGTRLSDGLQVAVKFIPKSLSLRYRWSADGSRRVPVEVALMERMSYPPAKNIITLIEWFDEPKRYILILERPQPSKDLYDFVLDFQNPLTEDLARLIMFQAVEAAAECHQRGVLHRDIKLENYLINLQTLELKLIDFGCGDWVKTKYSNWAGTFEYSPPEYIRESKYHAMPATVWSLGILLFVMVSRYFPFNMEHEILQGDLEFEDGLSAECCDLIEWCLQNDPAERPSFHQILKHDWFRCS